MGLTRINNQALTDVTSAGLPAKETGEVLQVVTSQTSATNSWTVLAAGTKLTDIAVNITPKSTSSKLKIEATVFAEANTSDHDIDFFLYRDNTRLEAPAAGSRRKTIGMMSVGYHGSDQSSTASYTYVAYIDTPSTTSQVTYAVGVGSSTSYIIKINRTYSDSDTAAFERGISHITVTEIAG